MHDLPAEVATGLDTFLDAAKSALGDQLVSAVLFGSAAEGRLRATSDVNLILVLSGFDAARIDGMRQALRAAHATLNLSVMFILESELGDATQAFAVKFADIRERHRVLFGRELFAALAPSRAAMVTRLHQILLNFVLRSRERYALTSLREEQLAVLVADAAGPLRSAAALILELLGHRAASSGAALEILAEELRPGTWNGALASLARAREQGRLPPGEGGPALLQLIGLAQAMLARVKELT
jgi:predicted nucleotidyltransferase